MTSILWERLKVRDNGFVAEEIAEQNSWHLPRLITVWVFALLIALIVGFLVPSEKFFEAVVLAIGFTTIFSFVLQLGTGQRDGFITRVAFSSVIAALVIAATAAIFWLI